MPFSPRWHNWPACDPSQRSHWMRDDERAFTTDWHCGRMTCSNCNPVLSKFRAIELLHQLQKGGYQTIWFGQISDRDVHTLKRFKQNHPETHRVLSLYYETDIRLVLADANMTPKKQLLRELPIEDAVGEWYQFALDYKLRKVHSDWDLSKKSDVYWIADVTNEEHFEVLRRLEKWYKHDQLSPDDYIRRYRSILQDLRNPRSNDLYS